jgi:hypothetical protein
MIRDKNSWRMAFGSRVRWRIALLAWPCFDWAGLINHASNDYGWIDGWVAHHTNDIDVLVDGRSCNDEDHISSSQAPPFRHSNIARTGGLEMSHN